MKIKGSIPDIVIFAFSFVFSSCAPGQPIQAELTPTFSLPATTIEATVPTASLAPEIPSVPSITDINWDPGNHVINIGIDPWPKSWSPWTVFVDGVEIPAGEENGAVILRPNAPLDQPPDGLIIGTLPWVTGLDQVDFPCCGSLRY